MQTKILLQRSRGCRYGFRNDRVYEKNILIQSAQAMVAQSNQLPQGILHLLKG
ncbi:flagellin [Lederbergia citrea]|uniref:flagellin n=1 Tax=Lederbergia citrea TaxID=2833581 RepID=UPI00201655D7|nr:flagellin [Lederbergia citrea]